MTQPLSKHQKFTIVRMDRSQIKGVPWNPRKISEHAKKKLRANLETVGLTGPIKLNSTTGNMFSGHQRLAILDVLEGSPNYSLDVSVCKMSAKREREQNIFENYQGAMGEWDLQALAPLLPEMNLEHAGFDSMELEIMYDGTGLFSMDAQSPEAQAATDELGAIADTRKKPEPTPEEKEKAAADAYEARQNMRKKGKGDREAEDTERYLVVSCPTREARELLGERLGITDKSRYLSEAQLRVYLKET